MPIKVTVKKLQDSSVALGELSRMNFPITLGYKIAKVITAVREAIVPFDETRVAKVKELAKKDDKGNIVYKKDSEGNNLGSVDFGSDAAEQKFLEELEVARNEEIELAVEPITITLMQEHLKKEDGTEENIKPGILADCDWLFQ